MTASARREHAVGAGHARDTAPATVPAIAAVRVPSPWRRGETVVAGIVGGIGVLGIGWCWYQASDKVVWRDQLSWLAGAAPFASLVVLAGVCWVVVGMRRVRGGFRELADARAAAFALDRPEVTMTAVLAAAPGLVTAESMTRAHRPDCLLMRGKTAIEIPLVDEPQYQRCGVCD
ncbi:MAG: hypothetical protein ACT4QG_11410 [Sporichthyaceae bacterium]